MRIRSIKPEFWSSEDIAALDWPTRLLFIGLWSYVDDNGVGRDNEKLIKADLFPLEDDPRDTLATVSRGLQALCDGGQIDRYSVDGKPFLHINAWESHQRIDRPNKPRYPLPTCGNAIPRETPATGTGEQGNRGTGDKPPCASADAERVTDDLVDDFAEWYAEYPRKKSKGAASRAYRGARKKASHDDLMAGLRRALPEFSQRPIEKVPYPATWLNAEGWNDEHPDIEATNEPSGWFQPFTPPAPPADIADDPEAYAEWLEHQRQKWKEERGQ